MAFERQAACGAVLALCVFTGCGGAPAGGGNRSPSASDHPEKAERALAEQEQIRKKNQELERKAFRGKELE